MPMDLSGPVPPPLPPPPLSATKRRRLAHSQSLHEVAATERREASQTLAAAHEARSRCAAEDARVLAEACERAVGLFSCSREEYDSQLASPRQVRGRGFIFKKIGIWKTW